MTDIETLLKEYDTLYTKTSKKLFEDDYNWPEVNSDTILYDDIKVDEALLNEFCLKITQREKCWNNDYLFSFCNQMLLTNRHYFDCGGITPVILIATYLKHFGKLIELDVDFSHDKWEARGDYCGPSKVGLKYDVNKDKSIKIIKNRYEEHDNM